MDWEDIKDVAGEFVFSRNWHALLHGYDAPETIQTWVNTYGVMRTFRKINHEFIKSAGYRPLRAIYVSGRKTITSAV